MASTSTAPTLPQNYTKQEAPTPALLTASGTSLSLTQQTITGVAEQNYGETSGLTAVQRSAAEAGMASSLQYPAGRPSPATLVASAVGVLATQASEPETSSAPGCSPAVGGNVSRVEVIETSTGYSLAVTKSESEGFAPIGSWPIETYASGGPVKVAVLDPNCSFGGPSVVAVTYPSGINFYDYTGDPTYPFGSVDSTGRLVRSGYWVTGPDTVLTSAHVNADTSYLPVKTDTDSGGGDNGSPDNAALLVVTRSAPDSSGLTAVTLHRLLLTAAPSGGGADSALKDSTVEIEQTASVPAAASLSYDNNESSVSDYAVATRSGSGTNAGNSVWFGEIADGSTGNNPPVAQAGACTGSALPQLSVADDVNNGGIATAVACTVSTATGTQVQRWSNFTSNSNDGPPQVYPGGLASPTSTRLSNVFGARPFVTWPCDLLNDYASLENSGATQCVSDAAAIVLGHPVRQSSRLYSLPVLGGTAPVITAAIAGTSVKLVVTADQLPLDDSTITVHDSSASAVMQDSAPTPIAYLMPAPEVSGLNQPSGGPPVAFGATDQSGQETSASFGTSVGGSVSATIGEPEIAAADLSVSAEKATNTTSGSSSSISTNQTLNDNNNEPVVVYTITPEWRWFGTVTADSTGIGVAEHAQVLTQIAVNDPANPPQVDADSVAELGSRFKAFQPGGTYAATLTSVFGAGVFGGRGATVANGDPASYPAFTPGRQLAPRYGSADYCDTHPGSDSTVGVTAVNSGVASPYTPADSTASGASYLPASRKAQTVVVGDGVSNMNTVEVTSGSSSSYSSDFSVNASAGVTLGNVSVTANAGFTEGNETSLDTSRSVTFTSEIGHIVGASSSALPTSVRSAVDNALAKSETYTWNPFICRRTTALPGDGQTAALVMGFETYGFTGEPSVGTAHAPTPLVGGTSSKKPWTLDQRSLLTFDRSGTPADFLVTVQHINGKTAANLTTGASTPAQADRSARKRAVRLPTLARGTYRWHVIAITFNGGIRTSGWRYIRFR